MIDLKMAKSDITFNPKYDTDYDDKISKLNENISELNTNISTLNTKISKLENRILKLENHIDNSYTSYI